MVVVLEKPLNTESLPAGEEGPFVVVKQYKNDVTLRHINGRDHEFEESVTSLDCGLA